MTPLTDAELKAQKLEELLRSLEYRANEATKGKWRSPWRPGSPQECAGVENGDCYIYLNVGVTDDHPETIKRWKHDAAFIECAQPQTVLDLIATIRELQRESRVQQRALENACEKQAWLVADELSQAQQELEAEG